MSELHTYLTVDHNWLLVALVIVCLLASAVAAAALIDLHSKRKLLQQKSQLDTALETMEQGLCMFDAEGRIVLCNDRYATMMGLSVPSLEGLSLLNLLIKYRNSVGVDTSDAEQVFARVLADAREGKSTTKIIKTSAGRTLRVNDQPIGKGGGWVSTFDDITEWRQAQEQLKESEERYRLLAEYSTDMIVIVDRDGRRLYVSPACRTLLGYEPDEMLQIHTLDSVHPDEVPLVREVLANRKTEGTLRYRMRQKDGRYVWVEAAGGPKKFAGEAPLHVTVVRNIEERIAAEDRLVQANKRLHALADEASKKSNQLEAAIANISQGFCMFDVEQRLLIHNDRYIEMYGLPRELIVPGCTFRSILQYRKTVGGFAGDVDEFIAQMSSAHAKGEPHHATTRAKVGRTIAVINHPVPDGGWVATHEDITERKRAEAKIEQLAHFDTLTSLANRNLFRDKIEEALARWHRFRAEFAIFLLDLDKFKQVNDTFGHHAGDALLQAVAARIRESIREVDLAARLGGDEFALIISRGTESLLDGSQTLAARLIEGIGVPFEIEGQRVIVGCSIGIALAPKHGLQSDQLLRNADLALYKSKNSGRNRFQVFSDELKAEADSRNELENDLRQAIWREEFSICYQPFVSLETGAVLGMEALARWHHPAKGPIPPDEFIPIAEEADLIGRLGEWVLTKACHDAAKMPDHFKIAVNISASQFAKSNLVDSVIFALVDSQLSPERLEIEITEGVLLKETAQNLETLRQLQNLGVSIALDDFGVGYSSLSYLTSFTFNKVKIDRSFVGKMGMSEARAVIKSVVQLAKTLKLSICAEGIETEEQLLDVKSLGVEVGQGYLFGRPEPLDKLQYHAPLESKSTAA